MYNQVLRLLPEHHQYDRPSAGQPLGIRGKDERRRENQTRGGLGLRTPSRSCLTYAPLGVQDVPVCLQRSLPSLRAPGVSATTASSWLAFYQGRLIDLVGKVAPDDVARLRYEIIPRQTRLRTARPEDGMNPPYGTYTERVINWGRRTCGSPSHQRNHENENFGERRD